MEVGMRTQSLGPRVVLMLVGAVVLSARLLGHHSYADYYLEADTVEIEGSVVEFQYKNPHSWIHVQGLDRDGITKDFIKVGDRLRIWASPNRNPNDNRIRIKRIERRSDKWKWGGNRIETR
jgi:hypothetical protein